MALSIDLRSVFVFLLPRSSCSVLLSSTKLLLRAMSIDEVVLGAIAFERLQPCCASSRASAESATRDGWIKHWLILLGRA